MAAGQEQPRSPSVLDARRSLTRQHAIVSGGLADGWFAGSERPIRQGFTLAPQSSEVDCGETTVPGVAAAGEMSRPAPAKLLT